MLRRLQLFTLCLLVLLAGCASEPDNGSTGSPKINGCVAAVHPLAARAAAETFQRGGNAVDAAVAAALTLGVVDAHNSGIGGGGLMLIHLSDGTIAAIDGRETAPMKAHRDMYIRDGEADTDLSQVGALASGVPGALAAYDLALQKYGRLTLSDLLIPAAELAESGFPIDAVFAERLEENSEEMALFEATRSIFLDSEGEPLQKGHTLRQPDLAKTYREIARQGTSYFYHGPFALAVDAWMRENGGILTAEDLARYEAREREPVVGTYREYTVVGFPPPSSGGVIVQEVLNILEGFDLAAMEPARRHHILAEAMRLAFADRAHWMGDADFVRVPKGLMDKSYASEIARRIDPGALTHVPTHGTPPEASEEVFGGHTTHIAAADPEGNWVALTATLNTSFGSKVVIPGTGVLMNNEMDDFSTQPGVPNAYGLVGAEANAVEPGKRPLSSMSPTIVIEDGRPILTLGAAGGPKIITSVVQVMVNRLDLGMTLHGAVAAPRIHHQWRPDRIYAEEALDGDLAEALRGLGHEVQLREHLATLQAIGLDAGGSWVVVVEPRVLNRNR